MGRVELANLLASSNGMAQRIPFYSRSNVNTAQITPQISRSCPAQHGSLYDMACMAQLESLYMLTHHTECVHSLVEHALCTLH
eukprot:scaffold69678_cov26-Tisochrysis_lutea.AAC.2